MCVRVHFLKSNFVRKQTVRSRKNADDAVRNEPEKNTSLPPFFLRFPFHGAISSFTAFTLSKLIYVLQ